VLSEAENISSVFLEQIFFKLRRGGIVSSVRGPGGGFCFTRPIDKLNVRDILEAAGEEISSSSCDKRLDPCDRIDNCLSHQVWVDLVDLVDKYLKGLTLAALLERGGYLEENEAS
jgi:Rrf2 family iron-sulfur cluster assembly transcriptional regulator